MKMRKLLAFILALVVVFSMCSTAFAAEATPPEGENVPAFPNGDVSKDYMISNVDIVLMARLIVSDDELTQEQLSLGDMNSDGELTNADIVLLARNLIKYSASNDSELTEEMEEKMISDYIKQNYEKDSDTDKAAAKVVAYFGTYGGCEVVLMEKMGMSAAVQVSMSVNGLRFDFPHPLIALYLYKDSQFLRIDEAYEAGWITAEDLQNVWALRDGAFGYSGKNNKEIAEELEKKIIDDFNKQNGYEDDTAEPEKVYVKIRAYYGTYSGCEAVLIREGEMAGAIVVNIDVNGYRFSFPDTATAIYLYKDSQFLRIDEAFEAGWITAEDVATIWNVRGGFFAK